MNTAIRLLAIAALWSAAPALAQDASGAMLIAPCSACHGADGVSPGAIPGLAGLDPAEVGTLLRAYRSGATEGTVMNRIARGYTDAEIDAMVEYLGSATGSMSH